MKLSNSRTNAPSEWKKITKNRMNKLKSITELINRGGILCSSMTDWMGFLIFSSFLGSALLLLVLSFFVADIF